MSTTTWQPAPSTALRTRVNYHKDGDWWALYLTAGRDELHFFVHSRKDLHEIVRALTADPAFWAPPKEG